jgi:hypothetical protein
MSTANTTPNTTPIRFDSFQAAMLALHLAVVAFVCLGWQMNSRLGLFAYVLLLPLIMMQWLFNRGSSVVNNLENWLRTGHWRDPRNPYEGHLFQVLLRKAGMQTSRAEITTLICLVMFGFWLAALYRMILITA